MQETLTATRRLAIAAAVCLLAVAPLTAQQSEQPDAEFQSFRLPGWSFTPTLAVGAIYDTNVALRAPRAIEGSTQGDLLFNVVPSGRLGFIGKHTAFSTAYRGFLRRYRDVEGLDSFDQRASLGFRRDVSLRLGVSARNDYEDSPTTDETEVNGVPFRRAGSRTNRLSAGADYRLSKFTTLSTGYEMTWIDFEAAEEFGPLTGGWIHGIRADLGRQISRRITVGGEYAFRLASLDEGDRQLDFQDAGGMIKFVLGPHTSAAASAGFAALHDRAANETHRGPFVRVGITHASEFATVGAGFERTFVPSFGFGGASASQELRGNVLMPLGRKRLYVQGSAAWRKTMPFEAQELELDTIWLRSTVGFAARRWARIEALYTYTRQDSVLTGGEIDRHRVGVQFVISQPMRIP
jgi:hypothetical protein